MRILLTADLEMQVDTSDVERAKYARPTPRRHGTCREAQIRRTTFLRVPEESWCADGLER
jgi:hypothetical protein